MATAKNRREIIGDGGEDEAKPKLAIELRLEELESIFEPFLTAVEEMTAPGEDGKRRALAAEDGEALTEIIDPLLSAPERIDQFVALIRNYEFREALLRGAVKSAEDKARGIAGIAKSLKDAAEMYLLDKGIKKVTGFANELALWAKPKRLEVHNEDLIPDGYFDTFIVMKMPISRDVEELKGHLAEDYGLEFVSANRALNKERLTNTLEMTESVEVEVAGKKEKQTRFKEVPGAEIIRTEKRLSIR